MGFTEAEQSDVFRVVSTVLWLGNLTFTEDNQEKSSIADRAGHPSSYRLWCCC